MLYMPIIKANIIILPFSQLADLAILADLANLSILADLAKWPIIPLLQYIHIGSKSPLATYGNMDKCRLA